MRAKHLSLRPALTAGWLLALAMLWPGAVQGEYPKGRLGEPVGTMLTIEGVRAPESNLAGDLPNKDPRKLAIDTVNGQKLERPIRIGLENAVLESETRYVLRGYETGRMIGEPNGIDAAFARKHLNQAYWSFHTSFVVTSVVSPPNVTLDEDPTHVDWVVRDEASPPAQPQFPAQRPAVPRAASPTKSSR